MMEMPTRATKNTRDTKNTVAVVPLVFASFVSFVVAFQAPQPRRIISLVPALTEMLFAIGAGPQVVAVSSFDEEPPGVKALPRVGALLDPDTERILSMKPDLVIVYGSQVDLQSQLTRASIPTFDYRHFGLAEVMTTMRELGARTGHPDEAERAAQGLEARLAAVRARVGGAPHPRTLLVFGRESRTLRNIYASGGRGFLHDMLMAAGGDNVFADIDREAVQATTEAILARKPEVILELRSTPMFDGAAMQSEVSAWSTLASVPAVRDHRVIILTGQGTTVPGPRVADGVERMARALHP